MGKTRLTWMALAIIVLSGVVFYSNSFKASFQFDDANVIQMNEKIGDMRSFANTNFWSNINIRPLSYSSFAMNYALHGDNVWGYHLVNLIIHILNAFLVFLLARFMIGIEGSTQGLPEKTGNIVSLFIAMLFLLHPLQTMGVTYIVQRMTSLAAMFYLLAVYLYGRGRLIYAGGGNRKRAYLLIAGAVVSGILGVFSKQSAITFPLAFLFFDLYFIRNREGRSYKKYLIAGFSILILAFMAVSLLGYLPRETENITRGEYLVTQFRVFLNYLQLLFIPVGQNVDHGIPVSDTFFALQEIVGFIILIGLLYLAYWSFDKRRLISFGIVWFFLTISVESSIIPIRDVMMEHRLYLPMFGFSLAVVSIIFLLCGHQRIKYCTYAFSGILIILGILTFQRNKVWESDYTLWKDSIQKRPENTRAMVNYGFALVKRDLYNEAIRYYSMAVERDSTLSQAYFNRGIAYFDKRQYKRSIQDMSRVLEDAKMVDAIPYFFRGTAYAHLRMDNEALADLSKSIEMNPYVSETFKNRALVYEMREEYDRALVDYNMAIQLNPGNRKMLINRSKIHYLLKDYQAALDDILQAERTGLKVDNDYIKMLEVRVANPGDTTTNYVIPRK